MGLRCKVKGKVVPMLVF